METNNDRPVYMGTAPCRGQLPVSCMSHQDSFVSGYGGMYVYGAVHVISVQVVTECSKTKSKLIQRTEH